MAALLNGEIRDAAQRSVLCWLATSDENGQPNVTHKEVFAVVDDEHIVIANIASKGSAKNIGVNEKVCLSFVDVFVQKGFKLLGLARDVQPLDADFSKWSAPLRAMVGQRFPIHSVFLVRVLEVEPILAPSYQLFPEHTTVEAQIQSALNRYGVQR